MFLGSAHTPPDERAQNVPTNAPRPARRNSLTSARLSELGPKPAPKYDSAERRGADANKLEARVIEPIPAVGSGSDVATRGPIPAIANSLAASSSASLHQTQDASFGFGSCVRIA